jgi:hypothetical protein
MRSSAVFDKTYYKNRRLLKTVWLLLNTVHGASLYRDVSGTLYNDGKVDCPPPLQVAAGTPNTSGGQLQIHSMLSRGQVGLQEARHK